MFGAKISNIKKSILQVLTGNSYYCKRKDENYDVIYKYNRRSFEAKHALCDSILNGDSWERIAGILTKIELFDAIKEFHEVWQESDYNKINENQTKIIALKDVFFEELIDDKFFDKHIIAEYRDIVRMLVKNVGESFVANLREKMSLKNFVRFAMVFNVASECFKDETDVINAVKNASEQVDDRLDSLLLHAMQYCNQNNASFLVSALMQCDEVNIDYSDKDGKTPLRLLVDMFSGKFKYEHCFFDELIKKGANINAKDTQGVSILEAIINKFFSKGLDHDNCCLLVTTLLFNNARFDETLYIKASQDKILKFLFDVVCNLKVRAAQGQEDVLTILIKGATCKKQTNDGRTICLSSIDLVNFSIHNNLKKALQHSIKQNELYLQGPAKVMANYQNLPLDMFECFWNLTKDKQRNEILELAAKRNNKKFLNAVIQYDLWQQKRNEMCFYNDEECFDLNFIYAVNNPKKRIKKL